MRTLLFKNNIHNTELTDIPGHGLAAVNLTVRKGLKWADVQVGDTVIVAETGAEVEEGKEVLARIFDVKVMRLYDIIEYKHLLKLEHDPACRTFQGLHKVMKAVYDGILVHELVTLVFYEIISADDTGHVIEETAEEAVEETAEETETGGDAEVTENEADEEETK